MTINTQKLRDGPYLRDGKETRRIMNEAADALDALAAEVAELTTLCQRQSDLLSQTAVAVRGPMPELTLYSHADIPSRVKAVVDDCDAQAAKIAEAKGQIEHLDRQNNALREALEGVMALHKRTGESWNEHFERVGGLFYRETGMLRPGKDSSPHTGPSGSERQEEFDKWVAAKFDAARAALSGESK